VAALIDNPLIVLVVAASVRLPAFVSELLLEKKLILPVVALPNWSVCLLVVPNTPVAVNEVAPVVPAIDAVGVPPATLVKANFALLVAVEPNNKSSLVFNCASAPLLRCQKLIELVDTHAGNPLVTVSNCASVPIGNVDITPVPEKNGNEPVGTPDQFCPVPPYCVPISDAFQMPLVIAPVLLTVNSVVPEALAVSRSPELV